MALKRAGFRDKHIQNGPCAVHGLRDGYEVRMPDSASLAGPCTVELYAGTPIEWKRDD